MGGGSLWVERIGQSRFYTGFSRSASSSVLAKVLNMLNIIYNLHKSLPVEGNPSSPDLDPITAAEDWQSFIQNTYGCLADDPIERGTQGNDEKREAIE
jgi:hypothetical protein